MDDLFTRLLNEPISVALCNEAAARIKKLESALERLGDESEFIVMPDSTFDNHAEWFRQEAQARRSFAKTTLTDI